MWMACGDKKGKHWALHSSPKNFRVLLLPGWRVSGVRPLHVQSRAAHDRLGFADVRANDTCVTPVREVTCPNPFLLALEKESKQ